MISPYIIQMSYQLLLGSQSGSSNWSETSTFEIHINIYKIYKNLCVMSDHLITQKCIMEARSRQIDIYIHHSSAECLFSFLKFQRLHPHPIDDLLHLIIDIKFVYPNKPDG